MMQIDFQPLPANSDMVPAAAPGDVTATGKRVVLDEAGPSGGSAAGAHGGNPKGFRETMNDLLREGAVGHEEGDIMPAPGAETAQEPSYPEGAILEMGALASEAPQKVEPVTVRTAAAPPAPPRAEVVPEAVDPNSGSAKRPAVETAVPLDPKVATTTAVSPTPAGAPAVVERPAAPQTAPDGKAPAAPGQVNAPLTAEAVHPMSDAKKMAADPQAVPTAPEEADASPPQALRERSGVAVERQAQATAAKGPDQEAPETKGHPRILEPSPAQQTPAPRSAAVQPRSEAEVAPEAARANPAGSGASQNPAFQMESLESAGKPTQAPAMATAGDTATEAVTTSAAKGAPAPQMTSAGVAKAEAPTPQPMAREEVVQQIVASAKVRLQNGQNEMRIQLKPEHLGQVRLNISTDQQQVMVKVVAELPMVKELLETNLHQLRSELQGQGLEIDKFDVSVGGDAESQNKEQQTWGQRRSGRRGGAFTQPDSEKRDDATDADTHRQTPSENAPDAEGVDYFA